MLLFQAAVSRADDSPPAPPTVVEIPKLSLEVTFESGEVVITANGIDERMVGSEGDIGFSDPVAGANRCFLDPDTRELVTPAAGCRDMIRLCNFIVFCADPDDAPPGSNCERNGVDVQMRRSQVALQEYDGSWSPERCGGCPTEGTTVYAPFDPDVEYVAEMTLFNSGFNPPLRQEAETSFRVPSSSAGGAAGAGGVVGLSDPSGQGVASASTPVPTMPTLLIAVLGGVVAYAGLRRLRSVDLEIG